MSANAPPSAALLGADAGGSHSTVVIGTADLTILGRADGPGSAMKPGGAAASAVVLAETARRAASQAGIHLPVGRAVVGAAGAGRAQEQKGVGRKSTRLESRHGHNSYALFLLAKKKSAQ